MVIPREWVDWGLTKSDYFRFVVGLVKYFLNIIFGNIGK